MHKNYFILNRIIIELNAALKGSVIREIFSQEKDTLVLKCENDMERYMELSVNPGEPHITLRKDFHRARKNSIDFFGEYLPLTIIESGISDHDRLIRITCDRVKIYFAVRGKHTNIFLEDTQGKIIPFKNEDSGYLDEFSSELKSHHFISGEKEMVFENTGLEFDEYRKEYPFIGKEITAEAKYRWEETAGKIRADYLHEITGELLHGTPAVFISHSSNDINLAVESFHIFASDEVRLFSNMVEALNFYMGKKFYLDAYSVKRKIISRHIDRELSKLSSKLNDLKGRIDKGSREEEYNKTGNLLLINLNRITPQSNSVELEDIYENNTKIQIKLDPKLSPQKNAGYYFTKAGNERKAYKKSQDLFKEISENYSRLLQLKGRFEKSETIEELDKFMKELHIKQNEKKNTPDDIASRFKHYIIANKYDLYVGKDSTNNDLLTMKFAKQNDYWFHARSVPGSHVVLRVINTKEPVPKNILKSAASIAAFHSKAKTSGLAPVSYTFKKYVTKKKGMEPGKVALLKEEVLLVRPEVPSDCEYVSGE